jgi:phage/plasmid-like protein (TIGR03299 family)
MTFATTDTLNWNVGSVPLFAKLPLTGEEIEVPGKVAQVRADNRDVVGITSPTYEVFQNSQLKELVYPLVDAGQLTIENMGYLGKGEKVFIQCAMADEYKLGNESFKGMITLLNSHNGSSKLTAGVTTERVICSNTFAMAQQDMSTRLAHRADIHTRALEITEVVNFVNEHMSLYQEHVRILQQASMNDSQLDELITNTFAKDVEHVRAANSIRRFFRVGIGNEGKTVWDGVNAITQWVTHNSSKDESKRFASANFGRGAELSRRAMNFAMVLA